MSEIDRFMDALSGQESGGAWDVVNPDSGAYGRFQIMPANWGPWAVEAGLPADAPKTAANQERVARFKLQQYFDRFGRWEDVAAVWYSGQPLDEATADRPQGGYPTIRQYVSQVMERFRARGGTDMATDRRPLRFVRLPIDDVVITGRFGQTSSPWSSASPHKGVDLGGTNMYRKEIVCPEAGPSRVHAVHRPGDGWGDGSFGNCVVIDHIGTPWYSLYAHMDSIAVRAGQAVVAGEKIGEVGYSGYVLPPGPEGAHTHWQICVNDGFPAEITLSDDPLKYVTDEDPATPEVDAKELAQRALTAANTAIAENQKTRALIDPLNPALQDRFRLLRLAYDDDFDRVAEAVKVLRAAGFTMEG